MNQISQLAFWYDHSLRASNVTPAPHMVADKTSNFAYIIWWWQFEFKEACTRESMTILGWDANIKSIQDLELSSICVGSFIICESPNWVVRRFETSYFNLALKSPIMTVRNGLPHDNAPKFKFRFDLNTWNLSCVWLGDLSRWMKWQTLLIHSLRYETFDTLKGRVVL